MQPRADIEQALAQLPAALVAALLQLSLEETWHPVRSLSAAPELPNTWWQDVTRHLQLTPQPDGSLKVPETIRTVLLERLMAEQPHQYRALIQTQAEDALHQGDIRRGLALLHELGHREQAASALEQWIIDRHVSGEFDALQEIMIPLPTEWYTPRIWGSYWLALLSFPDRDIATGARQALQLAYERGERHPRMLHALSYGLQIDGQYEFAAQVSTQALATEPPGIDALRLWHQHTMNLSYLRQTEAHLTAAQRLLEEAEQACHFSFMGLAHATLAYAREDLGDMLQAERHYQQATALYTRTANWPQLVTLLNNYAKTLSDLGRPAEALEQLKAAEQLPALAVRHHAWIASSQATIYHLYNRHAEAMAAMPRAVTLLHQAQLTGDELLLRFLWAERLALDGRLEEAQKMAHQGTTQLAKNPTGTAQLAFTSGVLAFLQGAWPAAEQHFQAALEDALEPWDQARAHLYLLALQLHQSDVPSPDLLDVSLKAVDHDWPLLTDASAHQGVLRWLAAQPGWQTRLDQVFGKPTNTGHVPLHLELFGPLEIYSQAGPLRFTLRRSAELLAFLALHGSSSRQQILAALWEGQADEKTIDLFKKTIRWLRAALRPLLPADVDPVIVKQGRYALSALFDLTTAWVPPGQFPAPAVRQVGLPAVRGPFLADGQGPWLEDSRTGIHEALLNHLQTAAPEGDPATQHAQQVLRNLI